MRLLEGQLQDEIFCWEGDSHLGLAGFNLNASALLRAIATKEIGASLEEIPMDPEFAEFALKRRGIEQQKLDRLALSEEAAARPLLLVELSDNTDYMLLVDGHHRYLLFFLNKQQTVMALVCRGQQWRKFIIV